MVKKLLFGAGAAALAGVLGVSPAAAAYDTNATSVIGPTIATTSAVTSTSAVIGGFSGGGTGGSPGLFGGGGGGGQQGSTKHNLQTQQTGLNAGGKESKLSVWVNGAYSTFDEDQSAIDSDGDVLAVAVGGDWRLSERLLAGLAVGYETSDVTTTFNSGSIDTDGYFIAPYIAMKLTDSIFIDATVGYASLESDAARTSGGAQITGSYDSDRVFGAANVTARLQRGKLAILPGAGVLWTRQESDSYTESNGSIIRTNKSTLGRLHAGARLQYQLNPKVAPFLRGDLEYDFKTDDITVGAGQTQPTTEDTGAVLGAGVVLSLTDSIRGTVEGSTVLGRSDFTQYNLMGNLRFSF